ncbi:hypothetical protein AO741_12650 [Pseudomonas sp. TTU2014-105ASC]|nr:hypothetical protein AO741_12650 [Pseudomonas sp. TTU2014-105ASC]
MLIDRSARGGQGGSQPTIGQPEGVRSGGRARRGHWANQARVGKMCEISMRALNHLEYGDGNATLKTPELVFMVFGMRISLTLMTGAADALPPDTR